MREDLLPFAAAHTLTFTDRLAVVKKNQVQGNLDKMQDSVIFVRAGISSKARGLRGGHQRGCGPGATPPELPSEPAAGYLAHLEFDEFRFV